MRSKGPIEGWLIFVIVAPSTVSVIRGVELTSLASMARVMCSMSSVTGMFEWNLIPLLCDRVNKAPGWCFVAP